MIHVKLIQKLRLCVAGQRLLFLAQRRHRRPSSMKMYVASLVKEKPFPMVMGSLDALRVVLCTGR